MTKSENSSKLRSKFGKIQRKKKRSAVKSITYPIVYEPFQLRASKNGPKNLNIQEHSENLENEFVPNPQRYVQPNVLGQFHRDFP